MGSRRLHWPPSLRRSTRTSASLWEWLAECSMNKKAYRVLAFARTERGEEQLAKKKAAIARSRPFSSGGRIRTYDLRVMSCHPVAARFQTVEPRRRDNPERWGCGEPGNRCCWGLLYGYFKGMSTSDCRMILNCAPRTARFLDSSNSRVTGSILQCGVPDSPERRTTRLRDIRDEVQGQPLNGLRGHSDLAVTT